MRMALTITAVAVTCTLGALAASADAQSRTRTASACEQLRSLKSVFPTARAVGLTGRSVIKNQEARSPVYRGRCGAFWTTYTGPDGEGADVEVTLYKTARDTGAPLAEPLAGEVHVLPNGAHVRWSGPDPGSVNGTPSSSTFAASAFRRLFIESVSISTSLQPMPISKQLRIHRRIENRFARLVAPPSAQSHTNGSAAAAGWPVRSRAPRAHIAAKRPGTAMQDVVFVKP